MLKPALRAVYPAMTSQLAASQSSIQLTLTAFVVSLALGQAIAGPLSDAFGRRPPLIAGLVLYAVTSVACAFAPSAFALVVLRFLQGLGAALFMPSSLATWNAKNPLLNDVLTGALAVLVASPCSAPFMGAALGAALVAPPAVALAIFIAVGAGLAAPIVLATAVSVRGCARRGARMLILSPRSWCTRSREAGVSVLGIAGSRLQIRQPVVEAHSVARPQQFQCLTVCQWLCSAISGPVRVRHRPSGVPVTTDPSAPLCRPVS